MKVIVVNDNVDKAYKILKKKIIKSNLMNKLKEKEHFTPPTKKRREELNNKKIIIFKYNLERKKNTLTK